MTRIAKSNSNGVISQVLPYNFQTAEIQHFRSELINWYSINRRYLPWRGDTINNIVPPSITPYGIWVSEVMAQQTRIETVVPYWNKWMKEYPDVSELSNANYEDLNRLWAGLGYYRRCKQLHEGAKYVCAKYNGVVPQDIEDLLTIPGIGPYTAGAISSTAFGKCTPLVDGNVIRVLSRIRAIPFEFGSKNLEKVVWELAGNLVDPNQPGIFNQALMELGALICTPKSPQCNKCPVESICRAKALQSSPKLELSVDERDKSSDSLNKNKICVTDFPFRIPRLKPRDMVYSVCVIRVPSSSLMLNSDIVDSKAVNDCYWSYLFLQRPDKGLLANQWEFPNILLSEEKRHSSSSLTEATITLASPLISDNDIDRLQASQLALDQDRETEEKGDESIATQEYSLKQLFQPFLDYFNDNNKIANLSDKELESSIYRFSDPVIHVFSHQRHILHVLLYDISEPSMVCLEQSKKFQFMSNNQITAKGITTGCKKILMMVENLSTSKSTITSNKSSFNPSLKRKRPIIDKIKIEELE
jgi:A/G-specific adenine glycosylase